MLCESRDVLESRSFAGDEDNKDRQLAAKAPAFLRRVFVLPFTAEFVSISCFCIYSYGGKSPHMISVAAVSVLNNMNSE
jgi:hypothetical protein